jgi:threonine dehydrogenase-like Zn-dependent dehydrogenase
MRQLVWLAPGRLEWQEADEPAVGPTDALLRPLAVARCDLDPIMAAFGLFPGPYPVGHEVAGEVVAVGDGVERHRAGDRVVVPFQVSCGGCATCRSGRFAACRTYRAPAGAAFGFGPAGGGHGGAVADRLLVPHADHMLHPAPAGLDPVAACVLPDNAVDAFRAVGPPLAELPGADVLVVGGAAASIGLYAVALAGALGAGTVRYADTDAGRCAQAERLGAVVEHHEGPWPKGFERAPITVENTGDADGLACTLRSTDDYGTCTPVAIHFAPQTPLPLLSMYTRGLTLQLGRADSRRHLAEVLRLTAAGRFDPLCIATTVAAFADAETAWLEEPQTKLVLTSSASDG